MSLTSGDIPDGLLGKLALLEKSLGPWRGDEFVPTPFNYRDPIQLQRVAKEMATFVGMGDLTFIITLARQADKVGGHIEINSSSSSVFIEIDPGFENQDSVLAILAHELAHKYLHRRGVSLPTTQDNEELTDLATIYMGFGTVSLNGSHTSETSYHFDGRNHYHTTSHTNVGYLGRKILSLAFFIHGISARKHVDEFTRHLQAGPLVEVSSIEKSFAWMKEFSVNSIAEEMPATCSRFERDLLLLASLSQEIRDRIQISLRRYNDWLRTVQAQIEGVKAHSNTTFIQTLSILEDASRKESEFLDEQRSFKTILEKLDWVTLKTTGIARAEKVRIGCPQCGTELRALNRASVQTLRCPKCNRTFDFVGPLHWIEKKGPGPVPKSEAPKPGWLRGIFRKG